MILVAVAAWVLSSTPDSGQGTSGPLPRPVELVRSDARLRAGVGGVALAGLFNAFPGAGLGPVGSLGVVFSDRFSVLAQLGFGTIIASAMGSAALAFDVALSEHWLVGVGGALTGFQDTGSTLGAYWGFTFPLRVHFAPRARASTDVAHRGLLLGLEVAPGFSLYRPRGSEPAALAVSLSATWAVW